MKSWKTTVTGIATILSVVAGACVLLFDGNAATNPDWSAVIAAITAGAGLLFARDANVSSEQQGIK